jgi:hypothetical protein
MFLLSYAQESNLKIFTQNGEKFTLFLNGLIINDTPQANVGAVYHSTGQYSFKVVFADSSLGNLTEEINLYSRHKRKEITFIIIPVKIKEDKVKEFMYSIFWSKSRREMRKVEEKIVKYQMVEFSVKRMPDHDTIPERMFLILINPFELASGYETMYLEYKFPNHFSLNVGAGHIFPVVNNLIASDEPIWSAYSGTVARFSGKYFFKKNIGWFVGLQFSYRDVYFGKYTFHHAEDDGASNRWIFHQSETARILGSGVIFGKQKMLDRHWIFESFLGLGLNDRVREYTVYDYYNGYGETRPGLIGNFQKQSMLPTVYAGFKIGYKVL